MGRTKLSEENHTLYSRLRETGDVEKIPATKRTPKKNTLRKSGELEKIPSKREPKRVEKLDDIAGEAGDALEGCNDYEVEEQVVEEPQGSGRRLKKIDFRLREENLKADAERFPTEQKQDPYSGYIRLKELQRNKFPFRLGTDYFLIANADSPDPDPKRVRHVDYGPSGPFNGWRGKGLYSERDIRLHPGDVQRLKELQRV
jgi:hypothetical protein